jgi:hypothetical protein
MIKKLIFLVLTAIISLPVYSQLSAGTLKLSLAIGNSPYIGSLGTPYQFSSVQTVTAYSSSATNTSSSLINTFGMQIKYFVADELAVKFLGGGVTNFTPGRKDVPGTQTLGYNPLYDVPTFREVAEEKRNDYMVIIGADKYISKRNASIYFGAEGGFRYGNASRNYNYEFGYYTSDVATDPTAADLLAPGPSLTEVYGFQGAVTFGGEYNADGGFFVGVEIRPVMTTYTITTIQPVPKVSRQADNLTFGFFTCPMLHVGINF